MERLGDRSVICAGDILGEADIMRLRNVIAVTAHHLLWVQGPSGSGIRPRDPRVAQEDLPTIADRLPPCSEFRNDEVETFGVTFQYQYFETNTTT